MLWGCPDDFVDVSKNRGTPKWMVYNGKPYLTMDDLGGKPLFSETSIYIYIYTLPKTTVTARHLPGGRSLPPKGTLILKKIQCFMCELLVSGMVYASILALLDEEKPSTNKMAG